MKRSARLSLKRETLTLLTTEDMLAVAGGATNALCYTGPVQCFSVDYCDRIPSLHCSLDGARC